MRSLHWAPIMDEKIKNSEEADNIDPFETSLHDNSTLETCPRLTYTDALQYPR